VSPLLGAGGTRLECWVHCRAPQYERCGLAGARPVKGHKGNRGLGAPNTPGEAERAGAVQPGEEKAQGDQNHPCNDLLVVCRTYRFYGTRLARTWRVTLW